MSDESGSPVTTKTDPPVGGNRPSQLRHLRRCFMHGKACTLIGQIETHRKTFDRNQDGERNTPGGDHKPVFVAMPFRPNLDTFYEWSLKSFISANYGYEGHTEDPRRKYKDEDIARADEYRNIGYVMCEKVCRRIQAADLVVVDISTENQNVFYEFGLAAGLEKQLLVTLCDTGEGEKFDKYRDSIAAQTGISRDKILVYPNVGFINTPGAGALLHSVVPPKKPTRGMRITRLLSEKTELPLVENFDDNLTTTDTKVSKSSKREDISLTFSQVLDAALGVALHEMSAKWKGYVDEAEAQEKDCKALDDKDASKGDKLRLAGEESRYTQAYLGAIDKLKTSLNTPRKNPESTSDRAPEQAPETMESGSAVVGPAVAPQSVSTWTPQNGSSDELKCRAFPSDLHGVGRSGEAESPATLERDGAGRLPPCRLDLTDDVEVEYVEIDSEGNSVKTKIPKNAFRIVAESVEGSFACVIDLGGEKPLAYFWLGYCHARGINVIPIYRERMIETRAQKDQHVPLSERINDFINGLDRKLEPQPERHVLAFDIRALWYIDHRHHEPHKLAPLVKGVLELLVERDVPRFERNRFWERLTQGQKVHIFTGAVHISKPEREMVGDWDLRTVSELVRSLASTHESVIPVLEPPIFSPTATDLNDDYIANMSARLANKNCLIIASADVNPMTEIALGGFYDCGQECFRSPAAPGTEHSYGIIAIKGARQDIPHDSDSGAELPRSEEIASRDQTGATAPGDTAQMKCPPYFSRTDGEFQRTAIARNRGFQVDGVKLLQRLYKSKDEAKNDGKPFSVLAHLVVMKNTFSGKNKKDGGIIVILGGVSGPATFGLAEVLTGGTERMERKTNPKGLERQVGYAVDAEAILECINDLWENHFDADDEKFKGIEAIIEVFIDASQSDSNKFADARTVTSWSLNLDEKEEGARNNDPKKLVRVVSRRP